MSVRGRTIHAHAQPGGNMKTISRTLTATLIAGTISLTAAPAVPAATDGPNLACATVSDCEAVIDGLYPQVVMLSAEVNDLRALTTRADRKISRKDARIKMLQEKLARARSN